MTLQEKKIIVDYLKKGEEVTQILLADLSENTYPPQVYEVLDGVFEAIMQVEELEKYKIKNDAENIINELEHSFTSKEDCDYKELEKQLRIMADESKSFQNRVFEIGLNAVLEVAYEKYK